MTRRPSYEQAAAIARFENEHGAANRIAPGPHLYRILSRAGAGYDALAIQSAPAWLEPIVAVVETDGRMTITCPLERS